MIKTSPHANENILACHVEEVMRLGKQNFTYESLSRWPRKEKGECQKRSWPNSDAYHAFQQKESNTIIQCLAYQARTFAFLFSLSMVSDCHMSSRASLASPCRQYHHETLCEAVTKHVLGI
jgi:hypothetical protein